MNAMPALKARPRMTVDDFMKLPEGTRAELIQGELIMSPSPGIPHQTIVGNLYVLFRNLLKGHAKVWMAPCDVHLPSGDVVQPDLLVVAAGQESMLRKWVYGAPALLVEVLSPDNISHDRFVKRDLYARNGVKEYWIVDGEARTIEVLVHSRARYRPHGYFRESEAVVSKVFPALSFPVCRLFEE